MSTRIVYNSLRQLLQADLGSLVPRMEKAGLEALYEAAEFMVTIAKGYCPVDTGTLERSIRKERGIKRVRVLAGGTLYINPKTNQPCNYAVYVEAHTPFMHPAWETVKTFIKDKIREGVVRAINEHP